MDFKKYKITNDMGLRIKNLPDIPNLSADKLKEKFDALGEEIAKNINGLIDDITNKKIGSDNIASDAVTSDKIKNGEVTEEKIKYDSINQFMLKENSVETKHINFQNVTSDKIADNAINSLKLEDNAVTEGKILDSAVTEKKINNNAVTENKIKDNSVSGSKIAIGAVTENKIKDNSVTESKIASGAVTREKIIDNAINSSKLDDNAVTREKILDGEVTEGKIASNAVTEGKILDGAVTEKKINNNAVTSEKIKDEAVTEGKIKDNSVSRSKIAIGAVTSDKIDNKSIDFSKLDDSLAGKIGKCDNVIVLKASDFEVWDIEYANAYDLSQITEKNTLIFIDGSEFVSGENYALYYVSAIMSMKKYVKGGELFIFKNDIANATATLDMFLTENELKLKNEWQLIEDITLEEAVQVVNIPYEKLQYKEVHIEAVIIPTDTTITSQDVTFGKSGLTYWNTKVSAKATGKIYAIMDVYLSPLNITIFDGTVSGYWYALSGGSFKASNIRYGLTESNLTSVCSSEEKWMWIKTTEANPMAIGTQIKVWGR